MNNVLPLCRGLSQYRITALEQEISNLSVLREQLETQNASLWNSFKGLETYQAEGKISLLTPAEPLCGMVVLE